LPLYEYGCPACGLVRDIRHGFDEKPQVACERCGTALVRRFSAAPIVFKGSGFYVTDSRASNGKAEKSESGEKGAPAEKTATPEKTEKKSEAASSAKKSEAAA
jgi:putative FmdB family regulatory protein